MMTRIAEDAALAIADEAVYADAMAAIAAADDAAIDLIRDALDRQPAPASMRVQAVRASFREMLRD